MPLTGYFEPSALTATAINAAAASAKAAGGGTVWLGNGRYTGNTTITFDPNCVSIEGADAVVDYSARTGNFVALTADSTNSDYYKRGMAHSLRGWVLRGNSQAGSVGAYFNTPLGAHVNSTVFNTENFVIERFGVNLDIGANCFICTFRGISLGYCVENHIRRLTFANNGENMSFFGGALYNGSGIALKLLGQNQEWRFVGTSFDYNKQIAYTDAAIEFHTCHFEASAANLSSLQSWQGVFEGDNAASFKFFGGEIGLTNTQLTNIDHFFKSWGTGGLRVEFHGCEKPNSLHYKVALCNDMTRIKTAKYDKDTIQTVPFANIIYLDLTESNSYKTTLTNNFYLPNPKNYSLGQRFSYWLKQDSVGNRKLLMIGDKFFGEPITLSTQPNYEDRLDCYVADANRIEYTLVKRTNTMIAGSLNPIMLGQIESTGGGGYLLDTYTTSLLAVSLRKIRSAYSGNCIQVRRSSDNATQNIGFVGDVLDTASLLSFVGANDGFITTWYDQSPTANNLIAAGNNAFQPKIVNAGSLLTENSKPTITFDGNTNVFSISSPIVAQTNYSAFLILNTNSITSHSFSVLLNAAGGGFSLVTQPQGSGLVNAKIEKTGVVAYLTTSNFTAGFQSFTAISAPSKNKININNSSVGSNTTATTYTGNTTFVGNIANFNSAAHFGSFSELVLFNTDEDANATSITTEQRAYYGI